MRFLVGLPAMHWLLATRQRVSRVKDAQLVCFLVRLQLVCYIFLYRFRILPYRVYIKHLFSEVRNERKYQSL